MSFLLALCGREFDIGEHTIVIAQPDTIDRRVDDPFDSSYRRFRLWMSIPAAAENRVDLAAVPWLPYDLANDASRVRIIQSPRQTWPLACNGPWVMMVCTPSLKRLEAG